MKTAVTVDPGYEPAVVDHWYFRQLVAAWRHRRGHARKARRAAGALKAFYALFLPERASDPGWTLSLARSKVNHALESAPRMAPCGLPASLVGGGSRRVLGYASSDLVTKHVVAHLVKGLFSHHDKER